jgi:hypothetical protein
MKRWKWIACAAVLGLAACGGGTSTTQKVTDAATKTINQHTASLALAITTDASGSSVTSSGSGAVDLSNNQGRLTLKLYGVPGVPDGASAEAILQLPVVYAHVLGAAAASLPFKTPWIRIDLRAAANIPGLDLGTLTAAQSATPRPFLLYLGSVSQATKVGTETIDGVSTTHYQATADLTNAVKKVSGDDATALNRAIAAYTSSSVPADVWIDGAGQVRRATFSFTVKGANGKKPTNDKVTFDFQKFGVPVDAAAPAAKDVTDVSSLLAQLGGG